LILNTVSYLFMTKKQSESNGVASLENIHEIEKLALPREIDPQKDEGENAKEDDSASSIFVAHG